MAKSLKQLYDQWDRVFMYFTCADYDMATMDYHPTHKRIIEQACNALEHYHKNIEEHFGGASRFVTNEQFNTPVEREIYMKAS